MLQLLLMYLSRGAIWVRTDLRLFCTGWVFDSLLLVLLLSLCWWSICATFARWAITLTAIWHLLHCWCCPVSWKCLWSVICDTCWTIGRCQRWSLIWTVGAIVTLCWLYASLSWWAINRVWACLLAIFCWFVSVKRLKKLN